MSASEMSAGLDMVAFVMSSEKFKAFVRAENELIDWIDEQCTDGSPWSFSEAIDHLGRCINKSLTFKLIPWNKAAKNI